MTESGHAFWTALQARERELFAMPMRERMEALNELLSPSFSDLAAEVEGNAEDERFTLVLTAHGVVEQFEALLALVRSKPVLPRIDIVAFRRRTGKGFGMRMDDFELASEDVLLRHSADQGQVALDIGFAKPIPMDMRDHARHMAFILLDHLLGEYDFAVKVGRVDFVEGEEAEGFEGLPLDDFAAVFDDFWRNELGHTGVFESGEGRWTLITGTHEVDGEEIPFAAQRNDSANSLVGRADLGHCLSVSVAVPSKQDLERARAFEDQLSASLHRPEQGCRSIVLLEAEVRTVTFYVSDAPQALARAKAIAQDMDFEADFELEFDPAWDNYGRWLD